MAKLKKVSLETLMTQDSVKVGYNRVVEYKNGVFCCFLHGKEIAQFQIDPYDNKAIKVCLDHCGYKTKTTNAAMKDFMRFFGVQGNVSFAKSEFSVWYRAVDTKWYELKDCPQVVTFVAGIYK